MSKYRSVTKYGGNLTCYTCEGEKCTLSEGPFVEACENSSVCWMPPVDLDSADKQVQREFCILQPKPWVIVLYCESYSESSDKYPFKCCQTICNGGPNSFPKPIPPPGADISAYPEYDVKDILAKLAILFPVISLILIICGMICAHYRRRWIRRNLSRMRRRRDSPVELGVYAPVSTNSSFRTSSSRGEVDEIRASACGDSTIREYLGDCNVTSGSGSGLPRLAQRTLAQQVDLKECLSNGAGKFGRRIWRGSLQGENVAVKIFSSHDDAMWARETRVYSQLLSWSHENILGYIGSDIVSQAGRTQLWLVCHYHKPGSLYNYLGQLSQPLTHRQMFDISVSLTNGLMYLHTVIEGTHSKVAMAHRNLSSKNVIVKANGTCALANLAHVVTEDRLDTDKLDFEQVSKRYMSPEVLEQSFDPQSLESFRRADMYSLGLLFWEVCRRCIDEEIAPGYAAPYSEWLVNGDLEPTLEEMQKLVVIDQRRPSFSNTWHSDPTLQSLKRLMEECWYTNASARLPILRVKKNLGQLAAKLSNEKSQSIN